MPLSPLDIHNKEFGRKMRGYDEDEVNEFLDQVVKNYEIVIREKKALEEQVKQNEEKLKLIKELKLLEKAGEIKKLQLQPRFTLQESFKYQGKTERKINYIADFLYEEKNGQAVVEDTKGFRTDVYKLKRKLFLKRYGDIFKFIES